MKAEIFGPVLKVVRWGAGNTSNPEDAIAQINALDYGLTLGIQTRIDSRAQALAHAAHVGNIYINCNMIDVVVGVCSTLALTAQNFHRAMCVFRCRQPNYPSLSIGCRNARVP